MAHFAEIDENNKVIRVLVIPNEFEDNGEDYLANQIGLGGRWIQTSYNSKIRNKFAGIGDLYVEDEDIFIPSKPYSDWLRTPTGWEAPKPYPDSTKHYEWDESSGDWILQDV